MMTKGSPTNQAIPYFLRAMRDKRPPEWVATPQGNILRQVESRLQTIFVEEQQLDLLDDLVAELERIKTRAQAIVAEQRATAYKIHQALTQPVKVEVKPVPVPAAIATGPNSGRVGIPVKEEPAVEDEDSLMKAAMRQYVETGDITNVVPNGFFTSKEESDFWSLYTMARITSVNGRTVHALKLSNDKPLNAVVLAQGVKASIGKAAILQRDKLITDVVMLPEANADQLSRTFNALYRRS